MNTDGASSSSHPPPPAAPPPVAAQPSLLAPGFRFHPTDEELVSYYLKRRLSGRLTSVEAIGEVDLYKTEPWDLPAMSRLRSRDMEWYFFSPLDRKYANRSRTNRATAEGYWKTTGKDRPVRNGPLIVGMKKTLVFHAGRAPRGERTNWVMHEYRLEDEEFTRAGIPKVSFVVCRIFQKSGTGPQNGAQYGAPFVEEEWEEADGMPLAVVDGHDSGHDSGADVNNLPRADIRMGNPVVVGAGEEVFLQLADFENNQNQGGNQHENAGLVASSSDGQISNSHSEDPIFLVEETFQGQISIGQPQSPLIDSDECMELNDIVDMVNVEYSFSEDSVGCLLDASNGQMYVNVEDEGNSPSEILGINEFFNSLNENANSHDMPQMQPCQEDLFMGLNATGLQDGQFIRNDMERNVFFAGQPQSPLIDYDECMELNDIVDMVNVEYSFSEDSVGCLLDASNGQLSVNVEDEGNSSSEILGINEFFNSLNENTSSRDMPQMQPCQEDLFTGLNDLLNPMANDHSSENDEIFYDASADHQFIQENFVQMQNQYLPTGDPNELNMMDDMLAYFDCTDNSLHYSTPGSSEEPCLTPSNESTAEVDGNGIPAYSTHVQASVAEVGASSMVELPHADVLSDNMNVTVTEVPDNERSDGRSRTFPKRLANMLRSFSAPPAYASESPASLGKCFKSTSRASSTTSIQVTPGVIQIPGFKMMSRAENWSLDRNGDMGFLLSFVVARDVLGKPDGSKPMKKVQGWVMSVVLRSGLCLFLLSALFLALSPKMVMPACTW